MPIDGQPLKVLPSQDPNRKEVLMVAGLKVDGNVKYAKIFEMIRDRNK